MSTVSIRRKQITADDFNVAYTATGELIVHVRGYAVELTEPELYMIIGTVLAKKRDAEDHRAVLNAMLPKGKK